MIYKILPLLSVFLRSRMFVIFRLLHKVMMNDPSTSLWCVFATLLSLQLGGISTKCLYTSAEVACVCVYSLSVHKLVINVVVGTAKSKTLKIWSLDSRSIAFIFVVFQYNYGKVKLILFTKILPRLSRLVIRLYSLKESEAMIRQNFASIKMCNWILAATNISW